MLQLWKEKKGIRQNVDSENTFKVDISAEELSIQNIHILPYKVKYGPYKITEHWIYAQCKVIKQYFMTNIVTFNDNKRFSHCVNIITGQFYF